jgi:hypothetical protein
MRWPWLKNLLLLPVRLPRYLWRRFWLKVLG